MGGMETIEIVLILAAAAAIFATRSLGFALRLGREDSFLRIALLRLPSAMIVALVAPQVVGGGVGGLIASGATAAVAFAGGGMTLTVCVAVAAAAGTRHFLG